MPPSATTGMPRRTAGAMAPMPSALRGCRRHVGERVRRQPDQAAGGKPGARRRNGRGSLQMDGRAKLGRQRNVGAD
jgi:hypothetical protein